MAADRDRKAIATTREQLVEAIMALRRVGTVPQRVTCGPADLGTVEPALAQLRPQLHLFCHPAMRAGDLEVS